MIMKLWPNLDNEEGLDTILEVPIPEEMYTKMGSNEILRWQNMRNFMKARSSLESSTSLLANSDNEFLTLLKIVGAPLISFCVDLENYMRSSSIKDCSIEASTAKYITQQYVAACGGHSALNSIRNMYAVGKMQMQGSEMPLGDDMVHNRGSCCDGKIAWNQSSSQSDHAHRGPPRSLLRFSQGLDPRCTASLFINALCIGEQAINDEDCFILKLETDSEALKAQSSPQAEIIHHTIWGYFSQRTGLLAMFEDKKLVRMKTAISNDSVFWETSVESMVQDYQHVDGINIAHSGKTITTLYRYGKSHKHKRRVEETWWIDEVEFNIRGLSNETFLPPGDLKREHEEN
ncbi:Sugar transporter, putative isoform 1 [Hibiscus syriacus]|uniref:Sugar transporter, putative isoform 1 n=1 Tax=Hibiscus syriacus TaxID=106335 RepID=A0A6A2YAY1_HIBSY|nr:Sugar transporter, putative isoform 1 [Hibiscus syriacus]